MIYILMRSPSSLAVVSKIRLLGEIIMLPTVASPPSRRLSSAPQLSWPPPPGLPAAQLEAAAACWPSLRPTDASPRTHSASPRPATSRPGGWESTRRRRTPPLGSASAARSARADLCELGSTTEATRQLPSRAPRHRGPRLYSKLFDSTSRAARSSQATF